MQRAFQPGILYALTLVAFFATAHADPDYRGVGGGGFLMSGAMHPQSDLIMTIGGDVSGIHVSYNGGNSWQPWTEGLTNADEGHSFYVEDLVGVSANDWYGFYAATRGGIYRAELFGEPWELMTASEDGFVYKELDILCKYKKRAAVIPFSAIDTDGNGAIYAGAGRIRWAAPGNLEETDYYPALENGLEPDVQGPHVEEQYSVWEYQVGSSTTWEPIDALNAPTGAVRDLAARPTSFAPGLAVATSDGVWLRKANGVWEHLDPPTDMVSPECWSIDFAPNSARVYAAFRGQGGRPSGVYRYKGGVWAWVGDGTDLDPTGESLATIGTKTELIYMRVTQNDLGKDAIYLGARKSEPNSQGQFNNRYTGLYRAFLGENNDPTTAAWSRVHYHEPGEGWFPPGIDNGYQDDWKPTVLFHPTVSPANWDKILVQFSTRLHTSVDAGNSYSQVYTVRETGGPGWQTTGYNELVVTDVDFLSDGRLVSGTGDLGVFRSTSTALDYFEWLEVPWESENCLPPNHEVNFVSPRPNWRGTGDEVLFVSASDNVQQSAPGQVFIIDPTDTWHNISCAPLEDEWNQYLFYEPRHLTDYAFFVPYKKYGGPVEDGGPFDFGVKLVRWIGATGDGSSTDPGDWRWEDWNNGLEIDDKHVRVAQTLRNEANGLVDLLAARMEDGRRGGLYYNHFDERTETWSWKKIFPNDDDIAARNYLDFWVIEQSPSGDYVYAGTRGRSGGWGRVLQCHAAVDDLTNPDHWVPITGDDTFGFTVPVAHREGYAPGCPNIGTWTLIDAGNAMTDIRSIVVDPTDSEVIFVGLYNNNAHPQEGLWKYDHGNWSVPVDALPDGIDALSLAIDPKNPTQLVVGTSGHEMYVVDVLPSGPSGGQASVRVPLDRGMGIRGLTAVPQGSGGVRIHFETAPGETQIEIFDVRGRRVHRETVKVGTNGRAETTWARVGGSRPIAAGLYFARVSNPQASATVRIPIVR